MNATEVIQNLGGIGDFVGAIGVIATLVYLGIQVNQTRKSNERDAAIELIRSFQTTDFTRMLQKSLDMPFGLTRKEFESKYPDDLALLYSYFATWESLGILVHKKGNQPGIGMRFLQPSNSSLMAGMGGLCARS